ncbi:MAG: MarR family transcriptional regulator [Sporichthyaceae bacterium]|nr:MarR family transcriptional regulator [Sporichthyaceae bacterium]
MYCSDVDDSVQATAATVVAAGQECDVDGQPAGVEHQHPDAATGLVQLSSLVQGIYARVSERRGLTPVQAKLLCVLAEGPRGMAELADCFGVEKAALTGLVDRAERRGLARRSPVPGDRRAVRVTLTDTGHGAATAFHAEVTEELNDLLAPLAAHDREHLRGAMAEVIAAYGARSPRAAR